jgi:hypothetical protein
MARPAAVPPVARPVAPVAPMAIPVARGGPPQAIPVTARAPLPVAAAVAPPVPSHTGFTFDGSAPVPPEIRRRRRGSWGLVKLALFFLIIGGVVGAAAYIYNKNQKSLNAFWLDLQDPSRTQVAGPSGPPTWESDKFNYSFQFPQNSPWKQDSDTKTAIDSNLFAMRRERPTAWMALIAKDYKTFSPREGEVVDEILKRLGKYFVEFEYEQKGDGQLGGKRATRIIFVGQRQGVGRVEGQGFILVNQGIAYALLTWSPPDVVDQTVPEFDELRGRFALLNKRDTWVDQKNRPRPFTDVASTFILTDRQSLWEPDADGVSHYKADLALQAKDPDKPDSPTLKATVMVLPLGKTADLTAASAAARGLLEKQHKEINEKATFEVLKGQGGPIDKDAGVGAVPGHITKLMVTDEATVVRFVTQAVVYRPDASLLIQCECPFERRTLWEADFDNLIASFQLNVAPPGEKTPPATKDKPSEMPMVKDKPGDKPAATTKDKP